MIIGVACVKNFQDETVLLNGSNAHIRELVTGKYSVFVLTPHRVHSFIADSCSAEDSDKTKKTLCY